MGESMSVEQEWLAELDGEDLRREPSETRKSTLKPLLRGNGRFGPEFERRGKARYAPG